MATRRHVAEGAGQPDLDRPGRVRALGREPAAVRPASNSTIEIDFYYAGVRYRPRLKLPPTRANLRYAENLLGRIRVEIAQKTFDYTRHFPESRRARSQQKALRTKKRALANVAAELDTWLKGKEPELAHSTWDEYERVIRLQLKPAFGDVAVVDMTATHVRDWAADRPNVTSKWINNMLLPLRQMLDTLVDDKRLAANPLDGLRIRRVRRVGRCASRADVDDDQLEDDREIDPFTPDEVRAIIAHASAPPFRNLCQFSFFSGLRPSELIALRWSDVDLAKGTVRVRRAFVRGRLKTTKTVSGRRTVTLLPMALDALKAQRGHTLLAGGVVFANHRTARPYASGKAIRVRDWMATLRTARVPYRAPKQMRHTYASMMLSAGENVMWVAGQMGHKDWTVTAKRYARFLPSLDPHAGQKAMAAWSANADQKADHAHTK